MLPSEKLRKLLSKTYNIDLEKYAWSEELKSFIFSIKLDKDYENNVNTMQEVYNNGFNIGHCGLTSRYLVINLKNSDLHYGTCTLLKGTKSSPNGNHAWTVMNNIIIDTTLMICIPLEKANELGYISQKVIAKESACLLPEYDTFSNEFFNLQKNHEEYENNLFLIKK